MALDGRVGNLRVGARVVTSLPGPHPHSGARGVIVGCKLTRSSRELDFIVTLDSGKTMGFDAYELRALTALEALAEVGQALDGA